MKKYIFVLIFLFNSIFIFSQEKKQTIDLFKWNSNKDSVIKELSQNGWEVKYDDITNSITASNPKNSVSFCGIKVKSIMLMFSIFDDSGALIGQSFSFEDKSEYNSFLDFLMIASKYSITMYDYKLGIESIRESRFYGYTDELKVSFYSFDTYDMDKGDYKFVHSVMFSK